MEIPTIEQIRNCDRYTIEHEPISSINLMERAAGVCVDALKIMFPTDVSVGVLCGTGNNGGDGLAMTRLLLDAGYRCNALVIQYSNSYSDDCLANKKRLHDKYPEHIRVIEQTEDVPTQWNYDVIVDALIGSGLNKPIESKILKATIDSINASSAFVFAVDMPSGLFAEHPVNVDSTIVKANYTLSFQFPKLGFFFYENYPYTGKWEIADIGLHPESIRQIQSKNYMTDDKLVKTILRPRAKHAHKGNFGHGLLIAGSKGMMGAAVLAAKACMRSGIGLLTVHVPDAGYTILQSGVNEALCSCDSKKNHFSTINPKTVENYQAVAIGPGLGKHPQTAKGLKQLMLARKESLIFDADAINILSENRAWCRFIPPESIFTPHIREFERLTHPVNNSYERMELQRDFSVRHRCVVVLKGAYTCVSSPDGECYFNTNGNAGMATAGSGDVLTGIILGLRSQGYSSTEAALTGVYLHGKAADIALNKQSCESLIASDIIENMGQAFSN